MFSVLLEPILLRQERIQIINLRPKQLNYDVWYMQAALLDHYR